RGGGRGLAPAGLVDRLHELGGEHGVGRIDHVEDRLVGIKSREIYEAPAATILHDAHRALEGLTLTKDTLRFNRLVANELAQLTYDGLWFSALHRDLRGYVASSQRVVSGEVRIRLEHGSAGVQGRGVPHPARPRLGGRQRSALAALALRQGPRDVRPGRRVRPRRGRRVHRDLRLGASWRGGGGRRPGAPAQARAGG